jgi:putative sigma-54 modulation protein
MSIRITGRHLDITDEIRQYVEKKLQRIAKYTARVKSVDLIIEKDHRYQYSVELLIKDGPVSVAAKAQDSDLLRAIDTLIDKAERQLKRKWEKMKGTKKQKAQDAAKKNTSKGAAEVEEEEEAGGVAVATRRRTRTTKKQARTYPVTIEKFDLQVFPAEELELPKLPLEDAAEELFYRDENFMAFLNSDNGGKLSILYRRKDGNFGLVEPKIE